MRYLIVLFLLASCHPSSSEDLEAEGRELGKEFLRDFKKISSAKDLEALYPKIEKDYEKLAKLILLMQECPADSFQEEKEGVKEELYEEIERVYRIPGGREMLENAQKKALSHLKRQRASS